MRGKGIFRILTGAGDGKRYMETAIARLRGFIVCVPGAREKGIVYGIAAGEVGEIKGMSAMQEAYEMGKAV